MKARDVKIIMTILAVIAGGLGVIFIPFGQQAESSWLILVACLLGIFARLAQAEEHHREVKALGKGRDFSQLAR